MRLSNYRDFYLLSLMQRDIDRLARTANPRQVELLKDDLVKYKEKFVDDFSRAVLSYLYYSCMKEIRHTLQCQADDAYYAVFREGRGRGYFSPEKKLPYFWDVWQDIPPNLTDLKLLARWFRELPWPDSYGGEKWEKAALVAQLYWRDKKLFLDSAASLRHNSSGIFDKMELLFRIFEPCGFAFSEVAGKEAMRNWLDRVQASERVTDVASFLKFDNLECEETRQYLERYGLYLKLYRGIDFLPKTASLLQRFLNIFRIDIDVEITSRKTAPVNIIFPVKDKEPTLEIKIGSDPNVEDWINRAHTAGSYKLMSDFFLLGYGTIRE